MSKNKMVRSQQLKFMILNLLAFTVIFTIFGVIIFSLVQNTLYSKTDEELTSFKEDFANFPEGGPEKPRENKEFRTMGPLDDKHKNINARIMIIRWDEEGNIVNKDEIGSQFYESYFQDYQLDKSNMNNITMTVINDVYHFRYILFEDTNENNEVAYTQLMINVDAEQLILSNFSKLIIICSIIFIVLSITASYILSKKMMKPIIKSWDKQTEFVENASHELRTPLTIIQNKLELLLTTPQEKISNKFENIALSLAETRRLSKLTTDLLTLARADSAETQLVKKFVNMDSFVRNVCIPYKEIAESQDKHFWLNLNCDMQMEIDEVRFHQLIVILLDNALKYTSEKDSIGVKTYLEDQKIVLEVSDTGMGIKAENSIQIFDRFYREDKARSRESGGVGLGLSIAQWIVEQHNATIQAKPNPTKGTTFKIKLPK